MNDDLLLSSDVLSEEINDADDDTTADTDFPEIGDIEPEDDMEFGSDDYEE